MNGSGTTVRRPNGRHRIDPVTAKPARPPAGSITVSAARNPALDGLRAVAVAGVVYAHLGLPHLPGGGVGVFAFFTLSGFIITYLLCTEFARSGRIALGGFWLRRARRLLPALGVAIVLAVALQRIVGVEPLTRLAAQAVPAIFYFTNWWRVVELTQPGTAGVGPFEHTWSLSVEEQFYLTWPLIVVLVLRFGRGRIWPVAVSALGLAVASAVSRAITWDGADAVRSAALIYNRTDCEAELLLVGAAAGVYAWHIHRRPVLQARLARWLLPTVGLIGFVVLAGAYALQPGPDYPNRMAVFWTAGITLIGLGVAGLCLYLMLDPASRLARILSIAPLPQLGRISYGIYLFHFPLLWFLGSTMSAHPVWGRVLVTALTLAVSALSWRFVERPIIERGRARRRAVPDNVEVSQAAAPNADLIDDAPTVVLPRISA